MKLANLTTQLLSMSSNEIIMQSQDLTAILKRTRRWFLKSRLGSGLLRRLLWHASRKHCKLHENAVIFPNHLKRGFKVFAVARGSASETSMISKSLLKSSRSEVSTHIDLSIPQKISASTARLLSQTPISLTWNAESRFFMTMLSAAAGFRSSTISASRVPPTQVDLFRILSSLAFGSILCYLVKRSMPDLSRTA